MAQRKRAEKRRARGEGSIARDKQRGGWIATLTIYDADGKRRRPRKRAATEAEAVTALSELRREYVEGGGLDARQTLADFLASWLQVSAKPRVRPSTYKAYEQIVRTHLAPPPFGRRRLSELRPHHVDALLEAKRAAGLSPKTRQHIRATLRRALNYARRQRYVSDNAASLSEPPRLDYSEVTPLTPEQAKRLLAAVKGDRLEALFTVAIALGMRQGELLGLRWTDVDLDARTLNVRVSLSKVTGKWELGEVKTARSRRTISLPDPIVKALKAHAKRQDAEREHAGEVWHGEWGLVFSEADGTPLTGPKVTKHLQAIIRAENEREAKVLGRELKEGEGLPHQRFHDLRHACASLLLAQGVALPEIQDLLGHASYAFTRQVYAHLSPEMKRNAADRMGAFLSG